MTLWFLCVLFQSIDAFHSMNPWDLSCKKREYRLITDQSSYVITLDKPFTTIRVGIGLDDQHISSLLTELWYEQVDQQFVTLQSSEDLFKVTGELNKDQNNSWDLKFSSMMNRSDIQSFGNIFYSFYPKSILNIQSTVFNKQIDLLIPTNQGDSCSFPNSSIDFGICCGLCPTCPEIKILHEHSRYDMIVTNRGLIISRFPGDFICSLFPSNQINRFWSTITHAMNIDQIPDQNDLAIVQHPYGMIGNIFYYSLYPFHQWTKQIMDFNFLDMLFIPHKQFAIFELNEGEKIFLRIYEYKLNKTIRFNHQVYFPEIIIERNISSAIYFHLYFNLLSNILYLIGRENIYASNNYGETLIRIWTSDLSLNDSIILDPVMFSDTGHIAFIYRLTNHSSCCQYFAIFSKTGLYYGWRSRIFRSSILMDKPFFFDSSGSLYFNTTPPLLVILATEQSLVATSNLLVNMIPGPFFVRETDLNRWFVFCSLSSWDNRFQLIGSTLRFEKIGLFFIVNMDTSSPQFAFCLQTSRLDYDSLQTSRQCPLTIFKIIEKVYLQLSGCAFTNADQNSTIITSKFPNIFIDQIINETFALGRSFQEIKSNDTQVQQWNIINIQKVEQILDRCLLKNIDENHHRPSFIHLRPTVIYPLAPSDQFVTKTFHFLTQNAYTLINNNEYLIPPPFNNRKSIIHQEFISTQLSCYLPLTRTITFLTKCLRNSIIRLKFDLSKLIPINPPKNFQLNRYEAGFPSVIVYNLDDNKNSICDGFKNCSCISSFISHDSIHCAEQFYTMDSTVNNRVDVKLWMENKLPNNQSIFFIEEISKRMDFEIIDNLWTNENIRDLFLKNFDQLTEDEIRILDLLSHKKNLFLGPNLHLKFLDEGLYHFRLTYLWGDQFCLTSIDLIILVISNTATLTSYLWNYFLACILIFIFMLILWIIYVIVYETISPEFQTENFFIRRTINEQINFEILVKIREQSSRLLPYQDRILHL